MKQRQHPSCSVTNDRPQGITASQSLIYLPPTKLIVSILTYLLARDNTQTTRCLLYPRVKLPSQGVEGAREELITMTQNTDMPGISQYQITGKIHASGMQSPRGAPSIRDRLSESTSLDKVVVVCCRVYCSSLPCSSATSGFSSPGPIGSSLPQSWPVACSLHRLGTESTAAAVATFLLCPLCRVSERYRVMHSCPGNSLAGD